MFQEYPVSLVKLPFFLYTGKIIQLLDFDNWHPQFMLFMSSAIGQEAAFGVYQNSGRFKVKFLSFGDKYYVITVNIATF